MKYVFYNVLIVRDANFHIPRVCAAWELPILQEIHGEAEVIVGDEIQVERDHVEAAGEKARLERLYKVEEDSKIPFVEVTYGRGQMCLKALEKAIKASEVAEAPKGRKKDAVEDAA